MQYSKFASVVDTGR